MDDGSLLCIWAKTQDSDAQAQRPGILYHPLILHLVDVASVVAELWTGILSPAFRAYLSEATRLPDHECRQWLAFVAAVHDIGKCTQEFQCKSEPLAACLFERGLLKDRTPIFLSRYPHGEMSTVLLRQAFQKLFPMSPGEAFRWASISGGHHGVFTPKKLVLDHSPEVEAAAYGSGKWNLLRAAILDRLKEMLGPIVPRSATLGCAPSLVVAGLVSVADWIASNQDYFPCGTKAGESGTSIDLTQYSSQSTESTRRALKELGWIRIPEPPTASQFSVLFPGKSARESQTRIQALSEQIDQPAVILIEAPMGEGKTEAALQLADRFAAAAGQRGIYFGLPTQASSNQIYGRICEFLNARYRGVTTVPTILAHGNASLSPEFLDLLEKGRVFANVASVGDSDEDVVFVSQWFVQAKRGLLTPFGVGTVDQALMACLITKHVFVRLFGLAGKVVIIDEVHAYDAYMSTLLERLLEWLGALRCSVVLLSATLPNSSRLALLRAWGEGATGKAASLIEVQGENYPRVSLVRADGLSDSFPLPVSERSHRTLGLCWLSWNQMPSLLAEKLSGGGCAAVICNTVAQAQQTYVDLEKAFSELSQEDRPELELFHARFVLEDRQHIEQKTLARFGPNDAKRPFRAVLVATQVIEQSLDLDFDLMVSELAPVDLLLQRSGRLHRHVRVRPPAMKCPRLHLILPDIADGALPDFGPRNSHVYQPYILLKTWVVLQGREAIVLPNQVEELIEAVYGEDGEVSNNALNSRLASLKLAMAKEVEDASQEARNRFLPKPAAEVPLEQFTQNPLIEDDPEIHRRLQAVTRLTDASVQVVCLFGPANTPSLDPEGERKTNLSAIPTPSHTKSLLLRSLSVTDRRLVGALINLPAPPGWGKSALLRHHKALLFGSNKQAIVNGWTVELHPQLGFRVLSRTEE